MKDDIFKKMVTLHTRWTNKEISDAEFIEGYFPLSQKQIAQAQERMDNTNRRLDKTDEVVEELISSMEEKEIVVCLADEFMRSKGIYDEFQFFMRRKINEVTEEVLSRKAYQ